MAPPQTLHYAPDDDTLAHDPDCPLCATLDHVSRPLVRHLDLRNDVLVTRWHCDTCQASYTFPEPVVERPMRFGESRLA